MAVSIVQEVPLLRERPRDGHKGTFGSTFIIAGSTGMSGAAILAGLGALRGGAGLVYLGIPKSILPTVASYEPSYLTVDLPCTDSGQLAPGCLHSLLSRLEAVSSAAIGPGLGQGESVVDIVRALYDEVKIPLVVDADGLNALAGQLEDSKHPPAPRIMTPHPGEFARLTGTTVADFQNQRSERATEFAARYNVTLVLKGAGTVVTDGSRLYVNTTGNSGMATGGTGDVLTGLLAALLAQGMEPFEAAVLGTYLHGLAGDLAARSVSEPGLMASDLPRFLGAAWLQHQAVNRA